MPDLDKIYVSVILPLRLEWEPVYRVPEEIAGSGSVNVGDRVTVRFAARLYSRGQRCECDSGRPYKESVSDSVPGQESGPRFCQ